jgi:multidrug efflux pump subunit AcrA (membrane-fusion protein)
MKTGFKLILVTLPIALIGAAFLAYTVKNKQAPEQVKIAERITVVRVIEAREFAVSPQASGFGFVSPARRFEAIAQVGGTAEYVNPMLKKGDILPKGAVILRLSQADFKLAVAQARANIRAAEGKMAEITVSEANLKSGLEIEKEALAISKNDLARVEKLYAAGTASQSARDAARAKHLAQRQKVQNLENSLALLPTQRLVQQEQIAASKAALETAELNLARTILTLPFDARVDMVSIEVGQLVRIGQTTASFDGIDAAEVEALIPAAELQKVFKGKSDSTVAPMSANPATVFKAHAGLRLKAKVTMQLGETLLEWPAIPDRISNTVDPKTGTFGVIVRVEKAYERAELGRRPPLSKGMFVKMTLSAPPINGIVVPRSALRNGKLMVVGSDSRLELLPVHPRILQGDIALITEGVEAGAQVVVSRPIPTIEGMLLLPRLDAELMAKLAQAGQAR